MPQARNTVAPQIIDAASEWFVTMREPDASTEDREAFADWLRASPVHVTTYLEIAKLWADAAHIDRGIAAVIDSASTLPANVISLPSEGASASTYRRRGLDRDDVATASSLFGFFTSFRRLAVAFAACVVIAVLAGVVSLYIDHAPVYTTDVGEQRTITLDDGSIVKLNSRSTLTVHLSPQTRLIDLVAGQALFEVAHDASRPFIVASGNSTIRAVGTQFDVNRKHSGTVVTVIQGRVRLDTDRKRTTHAPENRSASAESDVYLAAGEQVRIAATGAMRRTAKPNTAAAISWLQQELIFEDQPLADVVEEFNRYTRTPIVLADESLGELRINAVFHTTNPDSLLRFISRRDDVRVDRAAREVRISKR